MTITINIINRGKSKKLEDVCSSTTIFPWISLVKPPNSLPGCLRFEASLRQRVLASNQASNVVSGQAKAPPENEARSTGQAMGNPMEIHDGMMTIKLDDIHDI